MPAAAAARPWRVATAAVIRSAAATPIEPPRKSNSQTTTATRRPNTRPSPVSTDSSRPLAARASASSPAYDSLVGIASGALSQLTNDPSSSTASRSWSVPIRLTRPRLHISLA